MELSPNQELLRRQGRLLVVSAATSGVRLWLERKFQETLTKKLADWRGKLGKVLKRSGFLDLAVQQAQMVKRLPVSTRERGRIANQMLLETLQPLLPELLESEEFQAVQYHLNIYRKRMYELGAVTALNSMGFRATSRRITDLRKKIDVQKAVGDVVFELTDQEIISAVNSRAIRTTTGAAATVIDDTRRMIRDNVYLGNMGTDDVAKALSSTQGMPLWEARRLARTEAQQAYQTAMLDTYHRSGVKKVEWVDVGDHRVRPMHTANSVVGAILIGRPFPSGEVYPGESSPNCRCSLQADLSDPEILLVPWDGSSGMYLKARPVSPVPTTILPPTVPVPTKPMKPPAKETRSIVPKDSELVEVRAANVTKPIVKVSEVTVDHSAKIKQIDEQIKALQKQKRGLALSDPRSEALGLKQRPLIQEKLRLQRLERGAKSSENFAGFLPDDAVRKNLDKDAMSKVGRSYENWEGNATKRQLDLARDWRTEENVRINGEILSSKERSTWVKNRLKRWDEMFEQHAVDVNRVTARGLSWDKKEDRAKFLAKVRRAIKNNSSMEVKTLSSTTVNPGIAAEFATINENGIIIEIKGKRGVYLSHRERIGREGEMLLPRGKRWKPVKVIRDVEYEFNELLAEHIGEKSKKFTVIQMEEI